jgi:hypothetical protein
MWAKNMKLADQRWRENWERKLAERRKAMAKVERIADRIKRQRSWEAWQASKMLAAASEDAPRQLGGAQQRQQQGRRGGEKGEVQAGAVAAAASAVE